MEGMNLKPREIVEQLDRYIIGQNQAKRAVAVALRNRWRRRQLDPEMQQEVTPKNILMMGPTGVGKTEIARRLAKLVNAPFVKVEATKYTEVGYVGRDVESMVRDLVEASIRMVKEAHMDSVREQAQGRANERLVQALVPVGKKEHRTENPLESLQRLMGVQQEEPELPPEEREKVATRRDAVRKQLLAGRLEEIEITIEVEDAGLTMELPGSPGSVNIQDMMGGLMPKKMKKRTMPVKEARRILEEDEAQKLIDMDAVQEEALRKAEQEGILFIDEIDKVAGRSSGQGPDVSREGVQRDILPIVEGSTVVTKYGSIRTDFILFIAAGAFHVNRVEDLIPELQGRFPIRVELQPLTKEDFYQILTKPDNAVIKQYQALLLADSVQLQFTDGALRAIANSAYIANETAENIGARRLHTILELLLEDIAFHAEGGHDVLPVTVAEAYVQSRLGEIIGKLDVKKFIL